MPDHLAERTPPVLAFLIVGGFFAVVGLILIRGPEPSPEVVATVIGALVGAVGGPISYYFGSSRSSQRKDDALATAAAANAGPIGTPDHPLQVEAEIKPKD